MGDTRYHFHCCDYSWGHICACCVFIGKMEGGETWLGGVAGINIRRYFHGRNENYFNFDKCSLCYRNCNIGQGSDKNQQGSKLNIPSQDSFGGGSRGVGRTTQESQVGEGC